MLGAMGCAAPLLAHVNLLLVLFGGAALATAARLKWDPSTYVALRELFPAEYAALGAGAAAAGLALLLLPHLAATALLARSRAATRALLLVYAGAMCTLMLGEAALGAWLVVRVQRWLGSAAATQLQDALEVREYVKPLLRYFGRWHPLPHHIDHLIQEAEEDAPRNLYVALVVVALLFVLQPLAIGLALCVARRAVGRYASSDSTVAKRIYSARGSDDWEQAPLRTAYRNGRLVVL